MSSTPTIARHVRNALNKAGIKVGDLTDQQRARALAQPPEHAALRGAALAAWILTDPAPAPPAPAHDNSGPQRMRAALLAAGAPLHVRVLADLVLAAGGREVYSGKTPHQTMSAQLSTSSNSGGLFVKVAPGCFGLREWPAEILALPPIRTARIQQETTP